MDDPPELMSYSLWRDTPDDCSAIKTWGGHGRPPQQPLPPGHSQARPSTASSMRTMCRREPPSVKMCALPPALLAKTRSPRGGPARGCWTRVPNVRAQVCRSARSAPNLFSDQYHQCQARTDTHTHTKRVCRPVAAKEFRRGRPEWNEFSVWRASSFRAMARA